MSSATAIAEQDVLGSEWDVLVVLDAARYDVFADVYGDYLDGELTRVRSPGSATPEWAAKTFTGRHDLTYLSANPFVNSLGVPLNELKWGASAGYDWTAADHIADVVDVWRDAWDDDLGTVTPDRVTAVARTYLEDGYDGRLVVHYLQPHAPFLSEGEGRKLRRIKAGFDDALDADPSAARRYLRKAGNYARRWIEPRLGNSELAMQLGMLVELNATTAFDVFADGVEISLRRYYEQNLRFALDATADLLADVDGDVVVTADHGEAFGEHGVWEHHVETHIPPLVEVPWLRVNA